MDIEDLDKLTSSQDPNEHQVLQGKQSKRHCQLCGLCVADIRALKKHLRSCHEHGKSFWCTQCSYKGVSSDSLKKHRLRHHPQSRSDSQGYIRCMESVMVNGLGTQCGASFTHYEKLREHLAAKHDMGAAVKTETVWCASVDEFLSWKTLYEADALAAYRIRSKALTAGGKAIYKCTRSGVYKPEGRGLRRLKSQGTAKLGHCCTSEIRAEADKDGSVVATIFPFHYGHGTGRQAFPHLRIPAADRAVVKEKLLKGVDASRIVQDMRSGDPSSNRAYWITRKDLTNMAASLGVSITDGTAKDEDDVLSVDTYVEEMQSADEDVELTSQLAGQQATAEGVPDAAEPPPLLTPSMSRPAKNSTPENVARRLKDLAELVPSLPPHVLERFEESIGQLERAAAAASITPHRWGPDSACYWMPPPTDRPVWDALLDR